MNRAVLLLAIVFVLSSSTFVIVQRYGELARAKEAFRQANSSEAQFRAHEVQKTLSHVYEALRTIARLPGVEAIDRYAENFDVNARGTVQEIYNNLFAEVRVSEIYIVPADLEPDAIDLRTGVLQTPITAFDEFIVGQTKEGKGEKEEPSAEKVEEIEIFEYRLMKQQLAWFKEHNPSASVIHGLEYPLASGPEVVTCDNSRYSTKHPDDKDRSGLVFSVPFYGPDGSLRGCISAVLLTSVLRELLPGPGYALIHPRYDYQVLPAGPGHAQDSRASIARWEADPALIFSTVVPLELPEVDGGWSLWAGLPDAEFWNSPSARTTWTNGVFTIVVICGGTMIAVFLLSGTVSRRERQRLAVHNAELEEEVERRTRLEQELIAARHEAEAASRAKSAFLATMSHEIRTPMNGVLGMTQLLEFTELTKEQRRFVHVISVSGNSLLNIINDILDFSKIEAGKLDIENVEFDLHRTVEEVIDVFGLKAEEKGLEFACAIGSDVPTSAVGDPTRIRQVLINLSSNAVKFTEKGAVVLRVKLAESGDAGATFLFSISDTGIGIPEAKRNALFQSFSQMDSSTTRRFGGTGLGLAISKQLVELMGGSIGVDSVEGQGSTFWFRLTLPRAGQHTAAGDVTTPIPLERILVVDDNAINREVLCEQLRPLNCAIQAADSGEEALKSLRAAVAEHRPFDLAVIDFMMPGMDGEMLAREVRRDSEIAKVKLLMLTSVGLRGDAERARASGCDAFLTKPVKPTELMKTLLAVMGCTVPDSAAEGPPAAEFPAGRRSRRQFDVLDLDVLLVEDNDINRELATVALEGVGCRVTHAGDGAQALEHFDARKFDVILMDCQMPVMDGFETTAALRARERDKALDRTSVIALTADAMADDKAKCMDAGMDDYLTKPLNIGDLVMKLEQWQPGNRRSSVAPSTQEAAEGTPVSGAASASESLIAMPELLARCMGHQSLADRLLRKFVAAAPAYAAEFRGALDAGDFGQLEKSAHKLKGAAAAVAFERMRAVSEEMQLVARAGQTERAQELCDLALVLFAELSKELERGAK